MSNKENISYGSNRRKPATKIPVPVEPLPLLPNHLIITAKERVPLKTLTLSNNVASTSSGNIPVQKKQEKNTKNTSKKISIKCDLTHITKRNKNEVELTQNFFQNPDDSLVCRMVLQNDTLAGPSKADKVTKPMNLNDTLTRESIHNRAFSMVNDEEEKVELIIKAGIQTKSAQCQTDSITPPVPIIHKAVKNVKKSLKRPHSRELQGILTPSQQLRQMEDKAKRRLLPYLEETIRTPDYWKRAYMAKDQGYALDIMEYLLKTERKLNFAPDVPKDLWILAVNWLIKINGPKGNPAVILTACWYLNTIMIRSVIAQHKLQVVAAACFWIAQKLHGPMNPFVASKLTAYAKQNFSVKDLLYTELKVLNVLKFPTQPVVALDFIPYLSWWCDSSHPGDIEVAATFICMCGVLLRRTLCQQFPSVVAVAAVRNALRLLKKSHLVPRLETCCVYTTALKNENTQHTTYISTMLCRAILAANALTNRTLVDYFNFPPSYIARKIIAAAKQLPDLIS